MTPKSPRLAPNATIHRSVNKPATAAPTNSAPSSSFHLECEAAIEAIRDSIRALCVSLDADPLRPQDISRRFKLNKNLTWKFARVLVAENALDAIAMLPGPEGIEIFVRALEAGGADPAASIATRQSFAAFDETVTRNFGARTEFDLALDGMRTDGNLENSRRLVYRGLSGVVGVQTAVRFTTQIIVPSRDDADRADFALIAGVVGLRRLRPSRPLPVFRAGSSTGAHSTFEPLLPRKAGSAARGDDFLMREFSSFPDATELRVNADGKMSVELSDGPLGKLGESNLFFGSVLRHAIGRYQHSETGGTLETTASFLTSINIPAERLVSDLFVHRSLTDLASLRTSIHSTLAQPLSTDESTHGANALPIDLKREVHRDASVSPTLEFVPRHGGIIACAFDALGQDLSEFALIRVVLQYPPAPAALWVAWNLPKKPSA